MKDEFAIHVEDNLARQIGDRVKKTNPKYLYDKLGSQLFEQICMQPEYYLTRVELEILNNYSADIANLFEDFDQIAMIELGSGSSTKTQDPTAAICEYPTYQTNVLLPSRSFCDDSRRNDQQASKRVP